MLKPLSNSQRISSLFLFLLFLLVAAFHLPALYAGTACNGGRWVGTNSAQPVPYNALQGGQEDGQPLYVCRASYMGGMLPGKVVAGNCNIADRGKEWEIPDYEVLVDAAGSWRGVNRGYDSALNAGWENGQDLFLCRSHHKGGVHPGKVVNGTCHISYGGQEIRVWRFDMFYPSGAGRINGGSDNSASTALGILGSILSAAGAQGGIGGSKSSGSSTSSSSTTAQESSNTKTTTSTNQASDSTSTLTSTTTQGSSTTRTSTTGQSSGGFASIGFGDTSDITGSGHGGGWIYPDCAADSNSTIPDTGSPRQTICANQAVPTDYVVVKAGSDKKCPNWSPGQQNTLTIKRPGEREKICSSSTMPAGYVVTAEGTNPNCPNWSATANNTKTIERLR